MLTMTALASPSLASPVWGLECREIAGEAAPQNLCVMEQSLSHNGKWLATLRIAPQTKGARLQVQLPAGVHLGSGLFYSVDQGRALPLEFQRCDEARCYATRALDDQEFKRLQRGTAMVLRLRPEPQLPPVLMEASLAGVTALSREALK